MLYVHMGFPGQCNIVVCTVHTTFFNIVTTLLYWHSDLSWHIFECETSKLANVIRYTSQPKLRQIIFDFFSVFVNFQMTYSLTRFAIYETVKNSILPQDANRPMPFYQKALLAGFAGKIMLCATYILYMYVLFFKKKKKL